MKIFFGRARVVMLSAGMFLFFPQVAAFAGSMTEQEGNVAVDEVQEQTASSVESIEEVNLQSDGSDSVKIEEVQEVIEQGEDVEVLPKEEQSVPVDETASPSPFNEYLAGHLQIGTRSAYRSFVDSDSGHRGEGFGSGTYLGTIYAMDEKQNLAPFSPYVSWAFSDYVGVELAYDCFKAETVATNGYSMTRKTDGDLEFSGFILSLLAKYSNDTKFTPWAGLGLFFYSVEFDPNPDWAHSKRIANTYNHMSVDDVNGIAFSLGVDWELEEHWVLNFSCQYMSVDVDAVYKGYLNGEHYTTQPGNFPVDNISVRVGIGYRF